MKKKNKQYEVYNSIFQQFFHIKKKKPIKAHINYMIGCKTTFCVSLKNIFQQV